jgi:hypothetical protein
MGMGVGLAARVGLARAAGVEVGRTAVGGGGVAVVAWVGTGEGRAAEIGGRLAAGDWLQAISRQVKISNKRALMGKGYDRASGGWEQGKNG